MFFLDKKKLKLIMFLFVALKIKMFLLKFLDLKIKKNCFLKNRLELLIEGKIKAQTNTDTNAISDTLQSYHAMTPQQSKHIHDCDSMLTVICGSSERRDSLYQQMIAFMDSGNFVPPSETHLSDITMNIVYMSVCSNPNMRKIGEAILDGQKITPEQQKIVNTIKPWNKSVVSVVGGLGIRGLYFAPAPSDKNTHLGSDGNVNGKTQSLCGKGHKTQSQNRVIKKLLESGRLKASSH